jgi:hypothetical protein
MLSECHNADCRYAECHNAECRYAERHSVECRGTLQKLSQENTLIVSKNVKLKHRTVSQSYFSL